MKIRRIFSSFRATLAIVLESVILHHVLAACRHEIMTSNPKVLETKRITEMCIGTGSYMAGWYQFLPIVQHASKQPGGTRTKCQLEAEVRNPEGPSRSNECPHKGHSSREDSQEFKGHFSREEPQEFGLKLYQVSPQSPQQEESAWQTVNCSDVQGDVARHIDGVALEYESSIPGQSGASSNPMTPRTMRRCRGTMRQKTSIREKRTRRLKPNPGVAASIPQSKDDKKEKNFKRRNRKSELAAVGQDTQETLDGEIGGLKPCKSGVGPLKDVTLAEKAIETHNMELKISRKYKNKKRTKNMLVMMGSAERHDGSTEQEGHEAAHSPCDAEQPEHDVSRVTIAMTPRTPKMQARNKTREPSTVLRDGSSLPSRLDDVDQETRALLGARRCGRCGLIDVTKGTIHRRNGPTTNGDLSAHCVSEGQLQQAGMHAEGGTLASQNTENASARANVEAARGPDVVYAEIMAGEAARTCRHGTGEMCACSQATCTGAGDKHTSHEYTDVTAHANMTMARAKSWQYKGMSTLQAAVAHGPHLHEASAYEAPSTSAHEPSAKPNVTPVLDGARILDGKGSGRAGMVPTDRSRAMAAGWTLNRDTQLWVEFYCR
jgi:hypothetical protein